MDVFGSIQLLSVIILYILLIGRVKMLNDRGIKAFSLGQGKARSKQVFEITAFSALIFWTLEVFFHGALGHPTNVLPYIFYIKPFNPLALKIVGSVLVVAGFIIFIHKIILSPAD